MHRDHSIDIVGGVKDYQVAGMTTKIHMNGRRYDLKHKVRCVQNISITQLTQLVCQSHSFSLLQKQVLRLNAEPRSLLHLMAIW